MAESMASQTPSQRLTRNDVHFPLTTPRKRNPSIPLLAHAATEDGQNTGGIPRLRTAPIPEAVGQDILGFPHKAFGTNVPGYDDTPFEEVDARHASIRDLPDELKNRILDYIFGDMRPVNAASTSTGLSHRMRHPRRKAVSELALISPEMRVMVQERVYRHIKLKGTKAGLRESQEWFQQHPHLAQYVRHIEYWVPVWGDKAAVLNTVAQQHGAQGLANLDAGEAAHDFPGIQFKLSTYSATLAQIFHHLGNLFPMSSIFTLEGGHCKNSNMIKHFNSNIFDKYLNNHLQVLPNIKVFAMRGAWNIMRRYEDWNIIQEALPCLNEWHCGYAKPRTEAYNTINEILLQLPYTLRHVDISLDSMFSKDDTILGSSPDKRGYHICEQLGRIAPTLESLSYTGKVCECFWEAAIEALGHERSRPCTLKALNIVVKSCCRQRVKCRDTVTGDVLVEEVGGIMADGAGIGNLVFINAFERLVMGGIDGLGAIPSLSQIKIRYIDLDSPCQQLNPYWHVEKNIVTGIWNDRIVEKLAETRLDIQYERLEDGIGADSSAEAKKEDDVFSWTTQSGLVGVSTPAGVNALYPRTIPKSINTGSYRIISEARAS